jgi:predicted outer membrane lipoprotein
MSALAATPAMMLVSALFPDFAWILGMILTSIGVLKAVEAYHDEHDLLGYVIGFVTMSFGIASEFATVEGLGVLVLCALIIDPFLGIIKHYA